MARLDSLARGPRILRLTMKRILPRGLLARSLLIIVMPLVLLQVVSGVIFYDRHWSNVSRHRATALAGDISMVQELIKPMIGSFGMTLEPIAEGEVIRVVG